MVNVEISMNSVDVICSSDCQGTISKARLVHNDGTCFEGLLTYLIYHCTCFIPREGLGAWCRGYHEGLSSGIMQVQISLMELTTLIPLCCATR